MKGNERNVLIGMVVIALIIIAVAYKFFYSESIAEADRIQGEIDTKKVRLDELNQKNANRPLYESAIANSGDIIDTVLSIYGPGNTPEKTIMLIVDMCNKIGISIDSIGFQGDRLIYASEAVDETGKPETQIYGTGITINVSGGYTQFKKLHDYINSYNERMNVQTFSLGFDGQSGMLTSSMALNMYSVIDKNHEYVAPVIEDIEIGTPNIFRTYEKPVEEEEGTEETTSGEGTVVTENTTSDSESTSETTEE